MQVIEGESYIIKVMITNRSTKGGVPRGATLDLRVRASGDGATFIPTTDKSASFAPGESKAFSYTMSIPMGLGGGSGVIDAVATSPLGGILGSDTEYLTITAVSPPPPTDEELIYANWLRTGGTGSIAYWRSLGSPLYYTPPPEPEPEPEPACYHHYRVTYLDGSSSTISWESDPVSKPSLWDFVDRDELLSWTYLGCY